MELSNVALSRKGILIKKRHALFSACQALFAPSPADPHPFIRAIQPVGYQVARVHHPLQ
jgi:hypothetical protein